MAITIIEKALAPVLPRADPVVLELHCDFVLIPKQLDIDIGPDLELHRCAECGGTARSREKQGTLREQCDQWKRQQAKKEQAK